MNFKIFSDFETIAKKKFKSNNTLTNITVAEFLEKSLDAISNSKNSSIFSIFHTKSSRSNYIASELVLQYLENKRMKITIKCANEETHLKYFRKHSDKWLQRELQLRTKLNLFSILISDRKKKMISTNILKSNKASHSSLNDNYKNSKGHSKTRSLQSDNDLSSSFITPSPTPSPSPKSNRIAQFPISNNSSEVSQDISRSNQWSINLSSSGSQNLNSSSPSKSSHPKILNITEMSSENQFYLQKRVINESENFKDPAQNFHKKNHANDRSTKNRTKLHSANFDSEAENENSQNKEKYSVSEASKYRTTSMENKAKVPRFQQLNKRSNIEVPNKISITSNSPKAKQVTFADQNQILSGSKLGSFNNISNNIDVTSNIDKTPNNKSNSSSVLINSSKSIDSNTNTYLQSQDNIDQISKEENNKNNKHKRSRENRRRVRLSKNMPPKAKPVDDGDEYDVEFLREVMNEKTRSGRKEK